MPLAVATGSGAPRAAAPVPLAAPIPAAAAAPLTATASGADDPAIEGAVAVSRTDRRPVLAGGSTVTGSDIPTVALAAYQRAVEVIERVDGDCGLTWELLAAVGRIESDHGRYGGATLHADGTSSPEILGPVLNGVGPLAAVSDTDAGLVDGDKKWDRAVGPMQFLPSTWAVVGVDADGDGVRSADDINDAALGAAVFLCGAPGDLTSAKGLETALLRYNPSHRYLEDVLAAARTYERSGLPTPTTFSPTYVDARVQTSLPLGDGPAAGGHQGGGTQQQGAGFHHDSGNGSESGAGSAGGSTSNVKPDTKPQGHDSLEPEPVKEPETPTEPTDPPTEPTDPPTELTDPPTQPADPPETTLTGVLDACAASWCLDGVVLDVGDAQQLAATALADLDGDGAVETNAEELTGLAGTSVTLEVDPGDGTAAPVVLTINGSTYRAPSGP